MIDFNHTCSYLKDSTKDMYYNKLKLNDITFLKQKEKEEITAN